MWDPGPPQGPNLCWPHLPRPWLPGCSVLVSRSFWSALSVAVLGLLAAGPCRSLLPSVPFDDDDGPSCGASPTPALAVVCLLESILRRS